MSTTTTRPRMSDPTAQLIEDLAGATPEEAGVILAELPHRKAGRKYLATIPAPAQAAAQEEAVEVSTPRPLTHLDRQAGRLLEYGFSPAQAKKILRDFARMAKLDVHAYRAANGGTYAAAQAALGVVPQKRYINALVELAS